MLWMEPLWWWAGGCRKNWTKVRVSDAHCSLLIVVCSTYFFLFLAGAHGFVNGSCELDLRPKLIEFYEWKFISVSEGERRKDWRIRETFTQIQCDRRKESLLDRNVQGSRWSSAWKEIQKCFSFLLLWLVAGDVKGNECENKMRKFSKGTWSCRHYGSD